MQEQDEKMEEVSKPDGGAWRRAHGEYPGSQVAISFLLGWLLVVAGAMGTLYVPVSAWRTHEFVRQAVHAEAPIIAIQTDPLGRRGTHSTYRAIVEIVGPEGGPVREIVGDASYPNPYRVGDKLAVFYAAGKPSSAVRDGAGDVWTDTVALAILSPIVLLMGVGVLLWMRYFVNYGPEQLVWIDRWFIPLKLLTRI